MKTPKSQAKKNHPARWFLYFLQNVLELIVNESKLNVQGLNKSDMRGPI